MQKQNFFFYVFLQFTYWLLLILISKVLFFIGLFIYNQQGQINLFFSAIKNGIALDAATVGYLILIPIVFKLLHTFIGNIFWQTMHQSIMFGFTLIYTAVSIGEILLYGEWKTKLNMQALLHFQNFTEVFSTATFAQTSIFFALLFVLNYIFFKLAKYFFTAPLLYSKTIYVKILISIPSILLLIRGGLNPIPIQESDAVFSNNMDYNNLAINPLFAFGNEAINYYQKGRVNIFNVMPQAQASNITKLLFKDTTIYAPLFNVAKPNIIFVILESFSANCSAYLGGQNFTPKLDAIAKQGLAFSNCYASGYVSDQGIPAILSAYPAIPGRSIINQTSKCKKLSGIAEGLKNIGYTSSFYFGGQLSYGNLKNYLLATGWDNCVEQNNFPASSKKQKLGLNDEEMSGHFLNALNETASPFLMSWFTLSSHSPYDIPIAKKVYSKLENDYINTIIYTDKVIGDFYDSCKNQKWFNNSLLVFVADHSHDDPTGALPGQPQRNRIPLIIAGGALSKNLAGKKIETVSSQLDIAPTILTSLNIKNSYNFGKHLFSNKNFAHYCYYTGAGLVTNNGYVQIGINNPKLPLMHLQNKLSFTDTASSFLQAIYEDYRKR